MNFTIVVFLSVVVMTWLFGVLVVPRFDRPRLVSPARGAARETVAGGASRIAR